ncbi:MAG: hypothetical protein JSV79_09440 [Armatimonadota bacterium]|nr:MAG: hypothetical protein JSV79_09440 [Armatimonadota bacterium]
MKRYLLPAVLLLAVIGLAYLAVFRSARPRVLARVEGELLSPPSGNGRWVAWLEGDSQEARLVVARRHRDRPRVAFSAAGLSGLAVAGDSAFLTRTTEAAGGEPEVSLLRVDLSGGAAEEVGRIERSARQIVWGDGWLCWREYWEAALPDVSFVVAAAPLTVVRACREDGRDLHTLDAVTAGGRDSGDHLELIGIASQHAYWLDRRAAGDVDSTAIRRIALPDGRPQVLAREPGRRTAALSRRALFWSAPSLEAAEPMQFASVKRLRLDDPETKVIADWLDSRVAVLASETDAYAQGRHWLWRLGDGRGKQRHLCGVAAGQGGAVVLGDEEYLVIRSAGGLSVARRPLTCSARVRTVFSL